MSPETASALIAALALLIAVTTALWSRRALVTTTYRSATDLALEVDRLFVERPYLRPFFYENRQPRAEGAEEVESAAKPAEEEVEAAAELVLDVLECIWDNRPQFKPRDEVSWREWIHQVLQTSPVLRELYEENTYWYPTVQDLLEWEPCAFPNDHTYAAGKPGPNGRGLMFRFRRRTRNAPLLGRLAGQERSRARAS